MFRFIPPSTDIRDITVLDAKNWYDSISNYEFKPNKKYSVCTLGKYVKVIRQFFEEFKDMEIISRNPFRKIRSAGNSDPSRKVYVAKEVAQYFFENCPDYQSKMLIALARMAGLRIPSDIIMLKFEDIDFEKGLFVIHGLKGKTNGDRVVEMKKRICPIFPDLKPVFLEALRNRVEGQVFIFPVCEQWNDPIFAKQRKGKNISMNVRRWFKKLGIPLWAKLFVNCRASLITDLLDKYQQYFVCKWLGNTPNVADKYYRMITPEHIAVAAGQGDSKIANEIATKNGNENVNFSPYLVTFHANMQSCQLNEKKPYLQTVYGFKS